MVTVLYFSPYDANKVVFCSSERFVKNRSGTVRHTGTCAVKLAPFLANVGMHLSENSSVYITL